VAYSSIRMEPQYMIMGHAAGVAAAQAIRSNAAVQEIDTGALRERLRQQGQILSLADAGSPEIDPRKLPGVVVDNLQAKETGVWHPSTSVKPFVGLDYAHDDNSRKGTKRMRFVPNLPSDRQYEVRIAYSANPNRATNVPVTINTPDGPVTVTLNQRQHPGDGAPFRSVGVYRFQKGDGGWVEIGTAATDGHVVADAVQWLPAEEP